MRLFEKRCNVADSTSSDDAKLDEALQETFPASDPAAHTVETGIRTDEPVMEIDSVVDNRARHRFEAQLNGEIAFLEYERTDDALTLVHTEVPAALRGHHVGDALVEAALRVGRSAGLRIVAMCPFVRAYMRKQRSK
jgi:predicted GNAT family acetyltransferase